MALPRAAPGGRQLNTQDLANAYRASVSPNLSTLGRLGERADVHAWIPTDWPTEPVALDFTIETGTAVMVMRDDLHGGDRDLALRFADLDVDPVRVAQQVLGIARPRTGRIEDRYARFYERHLAQVARATHALIVVTREVRLPAAEGARSFRDGMVRGAALVFELASEHFHGGFEYLALNSGQVQGREEVIHHRLVEDLSRRFGEALRRGLLERFPTAIPPATLGA